MQFRRDIGRKAVAADGRSRVYDSGVDSDGVRFRCAGDGRRRRRADGTGRDVGDDGGVGASVACACDAARSTKRPVEACACSSSAPARPRIWPVSSRRTRRLPVIGVPIDSSALKGLDALLSTVQMPPGVPVATVAIGKPGATNAGVLAAQMMALADPALAGVGVRVYKARSSQRKSRPRRASA